MIKMFRIDERLIHGQIAIKWSRHTGVDHIVVGNDAAANSPIIQKSLKMAAPAGIKTAIRGVDDAIALLNDPRCESMKILMLVNSGRIAPEKPGMPRKRYGNNIYCDEVEVESFKHLIATGLKCIYQTTPEEPAEDITNLFK